MSKIWIAGAEGTIGRVLADKLKDKEIYTTDKELPVQVQDKVLEYADKVRPDVIINCAAITDVRHCEESPDDAYGVNSIGARNLARAAEDHKARMIYISSDDIFTGKNKTPLNEFSDPRPLSVYGRSKLAGERFVETINSNYVIVRSSWVYGHGNGYGNRSFVDKVIKKASAGDRIVLPDNGYSTPTSCDALTDFLIHMISSKETGIYHASCEGFCTREEYVQAILEFAGIRTDDITVEDEYMRPVFSPLDNMMLRITGEYKMPEWREALRKYICDGGEK